MRGQYKSFQEITEALNKRELSLRDNQIASLPADVFQGLTALEMLYLHNNPLPEWKKKRIRRLLAIAL